MDSKWGGWAAAGGLLMIMMGGFRAISGFIGLFNDEWVVRGFTGYYFFDITGLAWWMLIMGLLMVLAGFAILAGQTWGRVIGIIVVSLAAISELFWLPVYPIWSIMILTVYVLIVYGLIVVKPDKD